MMNIFWLVNLIFFTHMSIVLLYVKSCLRLSSQLDSWGGPSVRLAWHGGVLKLTPVSLYILSVQGRESCKGDFVLACIWSSAHRFISYVLWRQALVILQFNISFTDLHVHSRSQGYERVIMYGIIFLQSLRLTQMKLVCGWNIWVSWNLL